MPRPVSNAAISQRGLRIEKSEPEYPVREYIGAMAQELAQMARWDGDEVLGVLLDAVADRAGDAQPA